MFWKRFAFQQTSSIDTLLDREDADLESILDDDDLLSECKSQNTRLIDYFQRTDVLRKLLGYASGEIEGDGMGRFKYPHVSTEVLCCEIWSIVETCVRESEQLLVPFWDAILDTPPQQLTQKPLLASHFTKINAVFMSKKPKEMLDFITSQPSILERLMRHLETPAIVDLLFRMLQTDDASGGSDVVEWLSSQGFMQKLVSLLSPRHPPDLHAIVAEILKGIIVMCAPSPANANESQVVLVANRFPRQLVSKDLIQSLVGFMLDDAPERRTSIRSVSAIPHSNATRENDDDVQSDSESLSSGSEYHSATSTGTERSTSSLLHVASVIIELMRKNNSDFFEPYLFHTLRHRLIQVQQQYIPTIIRTTSDPQKRAGEDREILEQNMDSMVDQMGIVHFGGLLEILSDRLSQFQALLKSPRSFNGPILTTVGEVVPLTLERFRICELYAELLHCSNMSLLNRPVGYGPAYDDEGRLMGGLSALEELARVVSNGGMDDSPTPPPQVERPPETETEEPTPSRDLQASFASTDLSVGSITSGGDTEYLSNLGDDRSESGSDDSGHMEEINIHEDGSAVRQRREPLPPAPFAVPSPRSQPHPLPDTESSSISSNANLSADSSTPQEPVEDIDPFTFTDPNEIPPSPPSDATGMSASIISSVSLDTSRLISVRDEPEGILTLSRSSPDRPQMPPGDMFKSRFLELDVISTLLDLFFDFPLNNFLHNVVYDLLHQIMTGRMDRALNRELAMALFREGRLFHRIIEAQRRNDEACSKPKGVRLGFMGHLTLISEDVISALSHYPRELMERLSQYAPQPEWDQYVSGRFQETKERDASQLGGGKPLILSAPLRPGLGAIGNARAGGLAVDEGDGLALRETGTFTKVGSTNGIGSAPVQNVVFAARNEDDEDDDSAPTGRFARYLVQQLNSMASSQLESSSSDNSDDDDDANWLSDSPQAGDFDLSAGNQPSNNRRAFGSSTRRVFGAAFHDSFADFETGPKKFSEEYDQFGSLGDSHAGKTSLNFSEFTDNFAFPSSSTNPTFELDNEFGGHSPLEGFSFGGRNSFDEDDDGFGDFQTAPMLEVIASTSADGITQSLDSSQNDDFVDEVIHGLSAEHSMRGGKDQEDGERTPRASKPLFDDSFGENFEEVNLDPDTFGSRRKNYSYVSSDDPFIHPPIATSSDEVPKSHAMAELERSFGSVSLDKNQQGNLLDAFSLHVQPSKLGSPTRTFRLEDGEDPASRFPQYFTSSH
ncbi:SIT4 phosphatase-associated protein-domain-containing protein [Cantharellus anzutake]|uniref:SIT4 phosphatase-associated protein-domain-containing protein n=1 Tax=Cantharellus anzutake TaxID=1750568 RepID=UPI0019060F6C|nr:SIT4 phosphatase-associated protein-domain-containing protein [Cantharellus anzutake]KAF8323646.1 SIT4 phosphatase-associated protein-domain-containing protein [Cantharellus anzutake]